MEKKLFTIQSEKDGLVLDAAMFVPEGTIKGIFQISHGMAEHKERYFAYMEFLASQGYVAVIHDHRGHGKSVKTGEDLGYFYDNRAEYIVEDVHQITQYMKNLYPDQQYILFGHSMGSMVVRKYIKKYDAEIDQLIVCGSPSQNTMAGMGIALARFLEIFKGARHRSSLIQTLGLGSYSKNLGKGESQNAWICSNADVVQQYDESALCGFMFTLNGFQNLFRLMKEIYDKKGWNLQNPELPIFFVAGAEDPVIVNEEKWHQSQQFLREIGYQNVSGKLYPKLRHEILNEDNKKEVYKDIINFVSTRY